ncbi:hypothetical protein VNO77_23173 [Canavalia gladiata]|uniref:Uncharacterized protein n=1 Tax=Canavalia gladiata TaxID=3824 RepID=A0AAN9QBH5_CANGL
MQALQPLCPLPTWGVLPTDWPPAVLVVHLSMLDRRNRGDQTEDMVKNEFKFRLSSRLSFLFQLPEGANLTCCGDEAETKDRVNLSLQIPLLLNSLYGISQGALPLPILLPAFRPF